MQELFTREQAFSDAILELRNAGALDEAIRKCQEAITEFPHNNFFHKILGDICLQTGRLQEAADAYLEHLKYVPPNRIPIFFRFYRLFEKRASPELVDTYKQKIRNAIAHNQLSQEIAQELVAFLGIDSVVDEELIQFLPLTDSDQNYAAVASRLESWAAKKKLANIRAVVIYKLEMNRPGKNRRINRFLIQQLEKLEWYTEALQLIQKTQRPYENRAILCAILRICRRMGDYAFAEKNLQLDPRFISQADFNILYELVYYFQNTNQPAYLEKTLDAMHITAQQSIPIAKTLYNFYLTFEKFEQAQALGTHIRQLEAKHGKRSADSRRSEQLESEEAVREKLKDLVSEQEHNRQMIALRDLLKGFSHELGQPITNIRFAVQLHQMKIQRALDTPQELAALLVNILEQTNRIGRLLDRFRPIVSSKSREIPFPIQACIAQVFTDLRSRLESRHIAYNIQGDAGLCLYGDPLQFSQVFYNLVLNAMQAMTGSGTITVRIAKGPKSTVRIVFCDDGPGIPPKYHKKVFDPFFSTKDPTSGDGGEGLGLFVVWNIVKMFGGSIRIDSNYQDGARFIIVLPTQKEDTGYEPGANH